jgi:hypothetical protein
MPVERPTKVEFVLNMKTVKTLGLAIPPLVLASRMESWGSAHVDEPEDGP